MNEKWESDPAIGYKNYVVGSSLGNAISFRAGGTIEKKSMDLIKVFSILAGLRD